MKTIKFFILLAAILCGGVSIASTPKANALGNNKKDPKVILITLDGLRWQELFGGIDSTIIINKKFSNDANELKKRFGGRTKKERRAKLMPFFWNKIAKEGVLFGNRYNKSGFQLTNKMHFSYPGYNEILTGYADDENVDSNDKIYNKNRTILEKLNADKRFRGGVYAFTSWDVFPYIINDKRSGVPVNAGYSHCLSNKPTERELFIDKMQDETPRRWGGVRFDVFTHNYALETLKTKHPRVVYIGYGETDDYAHDGSYDHYLKSANNTDKMIQEIWKFVQNDPFYKDQTTIVITTDHGRGSAANSELQSWRNHGSDVKASEFTWFALLGNKVPREGEVKDGKMYFTNQIANTIAYLLDFQTKDKRMGKSLLPRATK